MAAIRELFDRGWGKAPVFAAIEGDPLELSAIAQEVQWIADELARRRAERVTPPKGAARVQIELSPRSGLLGSWLGLAVGCCHPRSLSGET